MMLESDADATLECERECVETAAQNMLAPLADGPGGYFPQSGCLVARRTEQVVSGFSRVMGPIGLLSCISIVGWYVSHTL